MNEKKKLLTTTQIICVSFLLAILIGAILLTLPISSNNGSVTHFVDALFTATTSTCVTGLIVVDTFSHWSFFGQVIILLLIQLGGLGIVTVTTTLMIIIGKKVSLKDRLLLEDAFNLDTLDGLVRFLTKVVKGTFLVEGIGAILCSIVFIPRYGLGRGIFVSIFHSISSFCNAGIDVLGGEGFYEYAQNPYILIITMLLIVMGGLGFVVWWDVLRVIGIWRSGECRGKDCLKRLTLHSKIVITTTVFLICAGAVLFLVLEYHNSSTIGEMNLVHKIFNAFFQSVTLRTAGFASINQKALSDAAALIGIILMFIGGSPIGTAGGIKTSTAAIIIIAAMSVIRGREDAVAFKRRIPVYTVRKAIAVILISLFVATTMVILLLMTEQGDFLDTVYEVVSALATVGLTRDYTMEMGIIGKLLITATMFFGRVGPISIAMSLNFMKKPKTLHYVVEDVRVG